MKRSELKPFAERLSKQRSMDGGNAVALSIVEAAACLRIGRTKMQELIRDKKIATFKIGRHVRVPVTALDQYVARQIKAGSE